MSEKKFKVAVLTYKIEEVYDDHWLVSKMVEKYVTEWEEVTKEELDLLSHNLPRMDNKYYGYRHLVVLDENKQIPRLVKEALTLVKEYKERKEKKKLEALKRKANKKQIKLEEKKNCTPN